MALFNKEGRLVLFGVAIGVGGAAALPFVAPVVAAIARPLTKAALTQTLRALEVTREKVAHLAEGLEDILAEVRAEADAAAQARKAEAREAAGELGQAIATNDPSKAVN
jgi:hypothetical protein